MKKKLIVSLVLLLLFFMPKSALSTFSLSVTPYEGGYDLRYGKVDPTLGHINREVTVNINSDIAKQYRLVQTLLEPLSTLSGSRIPQSNFLVYGIRGTNRYGTLNVEQQVPVSLGRQILYTSNQTGTSDSFVLVYGLIASQEIEPGSYRGRISFTLEPIDSTQEPVTAILNIFAEVEVESTVEIRTAIGTKNIILKSDKPEIESSSVVVNIKGGFGKQFRILQLVTEQPVSAEGSLLDWEVVNFLGRDAQKGIVINELTALSSKQQIVYTSSPRGEADTFVIEYKLGDLSGQKTGRYRARIKYLLEGIGFGEMRLIDTLDLEIDNPRIFDLIVTPQTGGLIQFPEIKPLQPPKTSEISIEIISNIGKRYQLTQNVISELISKEGYTIPEQYFTLRMQSLDTKGTIKFPEKVPVKKGDTVLFISDSKGSSDKFKIIYELAIPLDYHAGDYSTRIVYSLSEI